jgi:hypothetical protein
MSFLFQVPAVVLQYYYVGDCLGAKTSLNVLAKGKILLRNPSSVTLLNFQCHRLEQLQDLEYLGKTSLGAVTLTI